MQLNLCDSSRIKYQILICFSLSILRQRIYEIICAIISYYNSTQHFCNTFKVIVVDPLNKKVNSSLTDTDAQQRSNICNIATMITNKYKIQIKPRHKKQSIFLKKVCKLGICRCDTRAWLIIIDYWDYYWGHLCLH